MIHGYFGDFGSGKTLTMMYDAWRFTHSYPELEIVSNTPFYATRFNRYSLKEIWNKKRIGENIPVKYTFADSLDYFFELFSTRTNTIFLLDEGGIWLTNTKWNKIPDKVLDRFLQPRKFNIHFFYTVQDYNLVIKRVRMFTKKACYCERRFSIGVDELETRGKPLLITNIFYRPRFLNLDNWQLADKEVEKKHIVGRRFLFGNALKIAMSVFNTKYVIDSTDFYQKEKAKDFDKEHILDKLSKIIYTSPTLQ